MPRSACPQRLRFTERVVPTTNAAARRAPPPPPTRFGPSGEPAQLKGSPNTPKAAALPPLRYGGTQSPTAPIPHAKDATAIQRMHGGDHRSGQIYPAPPIRWSRAPQPQAAQCRPAPNAPRSPPSQIPPRSAGVVQKMNFDPDNLANSASQQHLAAIPDHREQIRQADVDLGDRNAAMGTLVFSSPTFGVRDSGPYLSGNPYVESRGGHLYPGHQVQHGEDNVDCAERKIVVDGQRIRKEIIDLRERIHLVIAITSENTPCKVCEARIRDLVQAYANICEYIYIYVRSRKRYTPGAGKKALSSSWKVKAVRIGDADLLSTTWRRNLEGEALQTLLATIKSNEKKFLRQQKLAEEAAKTRSKEEMARLMVARHGRYWALANSSDENSVEEIDDDVIVEPPKPKDRSQALTAVRNQPTAKNKTKLPKRKRGTIRRSPGYVPDLPIGARGASAARQFLLFGTGVLLLLFMAWVAYSAFVESPRSR